MQNKIILNPSELISKTKGQFIEPPDDQKLALYLSNLPYYDLIKGYKKSKLKDANNQFLQNLDIDMLYQIHWLDLSLSNLLLKFSLETEKHLKSELSTVIAQYGNTPEQYLNQRYYKNTNSRTLGNIKDDIKNDMTGDFQKVKDSKGTIPSWYLIQKLSLGRIINWYSILNAYPKKQVTSNFLDMPKALHIRNEQRKKALFKKFLDYILEVRNKTAHGQRILNIDIKTELDLTLLKEAGVDKYFKLNSKKTTAISDISNFVAIIILLTNLSPFAVNVYNEFSTFFMNRKNEKNNPLNEINMDAYNLFDINEEDLTRILNLLKFRFK
ncbi:MAG TPA: Abi family protein [Ligilactobacillus acidipiscis]|uniref:Abi family protein n=1 Tax=Ligilactobacillus acidipiscis TaxID=89059 RepID=A0A921K109_9LACO|nr:Abi family protein [Ligilactobacillus acidipiscis]